MSTSCDKNIDKYFSVVVDLVKQAGVIFLEGYNEVKTDYVVKSQFFDLVTVYDKRIEDLLINGLKKVFPECKFIGEEEAAASKEKAVLTDEPTWIIDPIDGTTNYIQKIPFCVISIGLVINQKLVIGVIYNPVVNELFTARIGQGAFLNGKQIRASNRKTVKESVIGYEISLVHHPKVRDKNLKRISKLAPSATGTRTLGSAALTLCYIACGRLDAYHVEDLQPWDIAAGAIILLEAGGVIVGKGGAEFNIMKPDLTTASTNELLEDVMRLIKEGDAIPYKFE